MRSEVLDLNKLNQRPAYYLASYPTKKEIVDSEIIKTYTKKFHTEFTKPWRLKRKHLVSKKTLKTTLIHFKKSPGYGENKQKHKQKWITKLEADINISAYPNFIQWWGVSF